MTRWLRHVPAIALLSLLAAACSRPPDAQAIRAAIEGMAEAANARRADAVLEHVAEDFDGNQGAYDHEAVARLVRAHLLARSVSVRIGAIAVEPAGDRATARFELHVRDDSGRWLPERSATLAFVTGWRREGGDWRCVNAVWSRD
jgi:ketosteroid isomerase-like protein